MGPVKERHDPLIRLRAYDVWLEVAKDPTRTKPMNFAVKDRLAAEGIHVKDTTLRTWATRGKWPKGMPPAKIGDAPDLTPLQREALRIARSHRIDLRDLKTVYESIESLQQLCLTVIGKADAALRAAEPSSVSEASDLVRASAVLTQAAVDLRMKVLGQASDLARPVEASEDAAPKVIEGSAIAEAPTLAQKLAMFNKSRRGTSQH